MNLNGLFVFGLFAASAVPVAAAPQTVDEILDCVRANLPRENSTQTVLLRSTNRVGDVSESRAKIYWQRGEDDLAKVLMRFYEPLEMRNAGVLMLEKTGRSPDTFLYLPATRMVRRVSSRAASSSLFGTDFSYEDFARVVGMSADASKQRDDDVEVAGRAAYVVSATPTAESGSAYERVVTFVDQETCVPIRIDSYETGGELRKRLTVDVSKISNQGGLSIPLEQTLEDLRDETRTDVVIETIDTETRIHRKTFSARELEAGAH